MNPVPERSPLQRFLRAVHRRMVFVRILEKAGTGLLLGSIASLLITPILLWQNEPAGAIVWISIALGAITGVAWGVSRRPTRVAAAIEADRQLRLSDLLSTALSLQEARELPEDASWQKTIVALGEHRVRSIAPRDVLMRQWGVRAWSATALAAMLALTLSIFSPSTGSTRAATDTIGSRSAATRNAILPDLPKPAMINDAASSARPNSRSFAGPDESSDPKMGGEDHPDEQGSAANDAGRSHASGADVNGTDAAGALNAGSGNAKGARPKPVGPTAQAPNAPSGPTAVKSGDTKLPAVGGSGAPKDVSASPAPNADGATNGGVVAGSAAKTSVPPPWRQSGWPTEVQRARDALNSGRVPDGYRDLIRDYFDEAK